MTCFSVTMYRTDERNQSGKRAGRERDRRRPERERDEAAHRLVKAGSGDRDRERERDHGHGRGDTPAALNKPGTETTFGPPLQMTSSS